MLAAVFGFGGRINRLQYFLGSLGLGAALIAMMILAFGAMGFHAPTSFSPALGIALLIVVLGFLASMWVSFSLQARRFRDMGWNPLAAILGWIGVDMVCEILALPGLHAGGHLHPAMTTSYPMMLNGLINLGLSGCLLFWPGADGAAGPPTAKPKAPKPDKASRAETYDPAQRAAPAWNVNEPRTSFGRRGL